LKFLDTNVFLRFLTNDDPVKADACRRLFRALVADTDEATTCEAVLAEVVHLLASRRVYGMPHDKIGDLLRPLVEARGMRLPHKELYLSALDIFATEPRLDFPDALCVAHMRASGTRTIVSYDRDFDRVSGIDRIEP
jgi:predicted nucleic acid-binding protein